MIFIRSFIDVNFNVSSIKLMHMLNFLGTFSMGVTTISYNACNREFRAIVFESVTEVVEIFVRSWLKVEYKGFSYSICQWCENPRQCIHISLPLRELDIRVVTNIR
jgi:hypothetical protein